MRLIRVLVTMVTVAAVFAQCAQPALARSADDEPARASEDRRWADLVRACTATAKRARVHYLGRAVEADVIRPEDTGVRIRTLGRAGGAASLTASGVVIDTLVAWNDVTRVEVSHAGSSDAAGAGALVGLAIAVPIAATAAVGAAIGSLLAFRQQNSRVGLILVGAATLGALAGAAAGSADRGGWITCCERDTSLAAQGVASTK